jgi:hypothetical protein
LYDSSLVKPHNSKRRRDAWLDHDHCLDARDVIRVEVRGYSGHADASSAASVRWRTKSTDVPMLLASG